MGVKVRQKIKGKGNPWWVFINHQNKRKSKRIGTDEELAYEGAKKFEAKFVLGEYSLKRRSRCQPLKNIPTHGLKLRFARQAMPNSTFVT